MPTRNLVKWYGDQFKKELNDELEGAAHQIGAVCVARIQRSFGPSPSDPGDPPGRDTGSYARTIDYEVEGDRREGPTVRIGTNDKRGPWLEMGTGSRSELGGSAYTIKPVRANMLHFKIDGQDVFAKKVEHPGIHPRPHFRPGVKESESAIEAILKKVDVE